MRYLLLVLEDDAEINFHPDTGIEFAGEPPETLQGSLDRMLRGLLDDEKFGRYAVGEIEPIAEEVDGAKWASVFQFQIKGEIE